MTIKVIACSGWKKSGKDTMADYLVRTQGAVKLSFAEMLKDMVAEQYSLPREWMDSNKYKEKALYQYPVKSVDSFTESIHGILRKEFALEASDGSTEFPTKYNYYWTPRSILILEGSVKRAVNSNYWVTRVINKIKALEKEGCKLVAISDLRYRSELQELFTQFGPNLISVRINRFDTSSSTDTSETDLNSTSFDITLNNKGSYEEYYKEIDNKFMSYMVQK